MTATARDILHHHGARGFFRGWTANYARLGPMTVLIFTTTEFVRRQLGMASL
jgi:solute carrier family 25 uncoupling protein 8/9